MIPDPANEPAVPEAPRRRFGKLRIARSVVSLVACVLLIVLWVRSYWCVEQIFVGLSANTVVAMGIMPGATGIGITNNTSVPRWSRISQPADEWLRIVNDPPPPLPGRVYPSRIWGRWMIQNGGVVLPFWFLTVVSATFVVIPWLPWRFSLRTLLIAMTAIAIVLGLIVWAVR